MNFFDATLDGRPGAWTVTKGPLAAELPTDQNVVGVSPRPVVVGVRPHDVRLVQGGVPLDVAIVEALGVESFAHGMLPCGDPFVARVAADASVRKGDTLSLAFVKAHLFDPSTGASLTP
jgi:sn-glycerol 3-phosphate transport system ATP-binding protein/multiple sugar transport system ATP-binding protein